MGIEELKQKYSFNINPSPEEMARKDEVLYKAILTSSKQIHKSKYKILGLEMNTYLVLNGDKLEIIGDQEVHIMHKKDEQSFKNGDILELSVLDF